MDTAEFISRLERIEHEIQESREFRHQRNEHISRVLDEERIERIELRERVDSIEESFNRALPILQRILDLIEGTFGRPGLVKEHSGYESRLGALETWRRDQRAFVAGIAATGAVAGGIVAALFHAVVQHFIR